MSIQERILGWLITNPVYSKLKKSQNFQGNSRLKAIEKKKKKKKSERYLSKGCNRCKIYATTHFKLVAA